MTLCGDLPELEHRAASARHRLSESWQLGYACGSALVDVAGNDRYDGVWLTEFLLPWCEATASGRAILRVHMTRSNRIMDVLERRSARQKGAPVPCFSLDSQTVALPSWEDGDLLWLADPEAECFYRVKGTCVVVVARFGHPWARLGLLRVVRELLTSCMLSADSVADIHAAAFSIAGKGVLLAGGKGAGKTSLLCHALESGGAALLANDRVLVHFDGTEPIMRGVPTVVSIRPNTLDAFPRLRRCDGNRPVVFDAGESEPIVHLSLEKRSPSSSLFLTPSQFADRLASVRVSCASVHAIIIPQVSDAVENWALERLSDEEGLVHLETCTYGVAARREGETIFGALSGFRVTETPKRERVARLASRVPVYRCLLGPNVYRTSPEGLFRALGLYASAHGGQV